MTRVSAGFKPVQLEAPFYEVGSGRPPRPPKKWVETLALWLVPNQKSKIVNRYLPAAGRIDIQKKPMLEPFIGSFSIFHRPIISAMRSERKTTLDAQRPH